MPTNLAYKYRSQTQLQKILVTNMVRLPNNSFTKQLLLKNWIYRSTMFTNECSFIFIFIFLFYSLTHTHMYIGHIYTYFWIFLGKNRSEKREELSVVRVFVMLLPCYFLSCFCRNIFFVLFSSDDCLNWLRIDYEYVQNTN